MGPIPIILKLLNIPPRHIWLYAARQHPDIALIERTYFVIVLGVALYFIYHLRDHKSSRQIVWVFLPGFLSGLVSEIFGWIYASKEGAVFNIINTANIFAVIWMFGFGFYIFRQNRKEQKSEEKKKKKSTSWKLKS